MKHRSKALMLGLILAISLCGCSSNNEETSTEDTEATQETIVESIIAETESSKDKDKDKSNSGIYDMLDIDNIENVGVELEDPAGLELEDIPVTSGKVVDTSGNFDVYELENTGINDNLTLFDGDHDKYMYNLNNFVTTLSLINLNRVTRYLSDETYENEYGSTLENDLHSIHVALEGIDTKNIVINTYFTHDSELVNSWNSFYQDISLRKKDIMNLNKSNVAEYNIESLIDKASTLSGVLYDRVKGYGLATVQTAPYSSEEIIEE